MSLLLHGPEEEIQKLSRFIRYYEELLRSNSRTINQEESTDRKYSWTIENKYYLASLMLHLVDYHQKEEFTDEFEGIILIPHQSQPNLGHSIYSLGHEASDKELGLRLLVSFTEADITEGIANHENLLWAVDHGFEYIEINETSLFQTHDERDKIGLPRVIEALQSVMWSTAQRKTTPKVKPMESNVTREQVAPNPASSAVPDPSSSKTPTSENEDSFFSNLNRESIDDDEDEEDMKFFELFAASLNEARTIRERAMNGQLSDQDRRAQAAAMAKKLSAMLKLDEAESDDDEVIV